MIVFDGQSGNNVPDPGSVPTLVMADRGEPWVNTSQNGQGFYALDVTVADRVGPVLGGWERSVVVMVGGVQDVEDGADADAVLDAFETYAGLLRDLGADRVIATTITGSVNFDATEEAMRVAANALIAGSAAFDAVVDIAALDPERAGDGVHWTEAGAQVVADALAPVLDAQVLALMGGGGG